MQLETSPQALKESSFKERTFCMGCGSGHVFLPFMDLGNPYLNDFVLPTETWKCKRFPLKLVRCQQCSLVQQAYEAPLDWHFRNYWYRSGVTQTMRDHLLEIAKEATDRVKLIPGDSVLDIGCNDGTLLRMYPKNVHRVGYEPALNLTEMAEEGGNTIIADYFGGELPRHKFKIITSISMFYDVSHPNIFLRDVSECLHRDGVFILQMNYLKSMLEGRSFDNIGHEHLAYYSFVSLYPMLVRAGLYPVRVSVNDLNGGSIRIICCKPSLSMTVDHDSVNRIIKDEQIFGLSSSSVCERFVFDVELVRKKLLAFITNQQYVGSRIHVYGASTRGSTILQYLGYPDGNGLRPIEFAAERDPRKYGLVTSGTWIKIIPEEESRKKADIFFVLPYFFRSEIIVREHEFLQKGGKLLFPLPKPHLVWLEGEQQLNQLL